MPSATLCQTRQAVAPTGRSLLAAVLLVALAVRAWVLATHTYVVWPDETFQYLEPAHRLAFGSGVITWEFLDGIRSWFLPGLLAGVMWLVARVDPDPQAYVPVLRGLCVLASLSVPYVGFRLGWRRGGPATAVLTGLLCALSIDTVYFAPVIMSEPLATDAALLAFWLGDAPPGGAPSRRRLLAAGLLFGLACSLRYQYAPVLAVVALLQHARAPRRLVVVAAGGLAVVLPVLGGLDWLTWGVPFQSVWLNYLRNATQGVSAAIGTEPWFHYALYYFLSWGALAPVLLVAVAVGAVRAPVLGVLVFATIALHAPIPHKELRFVFLATAGLPMLMGLGLGFALERLPRHRAASVVALGVSVVIAAATLGDATAPDAWHRRRSTLQAMAAARALPEACGLAVRGIVVYGTGGYTYWHRDAPIYFEAWEDSQVLPGAAFRLRLDSVLDGRPVLQYPGAALLANAGRFNVMIGKRNDAPPGWSERSCHGVGTADDPVYCVFARSGGCE